MSSSVIDAVRPHLPTDLDVPAGLGEDDQHSLLHALAAVPDPRRRRGVRYRLASLLAVAVCAVLAGGSTFAAIADWVADLDPPARCRLGLADRIPWAARCGGSWSGSTPRVGLVLTEHPTLGVGTGGDLLHRAHRDRGCCQRAGAVQQAAPQRLVFRDADAISQDRL